jgi:hypothetical protein
MSLSIGGLFLQLNPGGVVFNGGRQTTSRQAHLLGPHCAGNEIVKPSIPEIPYYFWGFSCE